METTFNDNDQGIPGEAKVHTTDAGDASLDLHGSGSLEVHHLMADTRDLLGRVAHLADPEIARLRARIERGLATAKRTLADGTVRVQHHAKEVITAGDVYVREQPWQTVGIAAAAGLVVGFLAARR